MTEYEPHTISCMEVWGGNNQTQKSISIPGFDIWVGSVPYSNEPQGGDIYYLSSCGAGNVTRLSLADVAGHGEASAYLAKRLRRLMRRYINTIDQQDFAQSLNEDFIQLSSRGTYATALLTAYHTETDYMVICNAGHPQPLLYRQSTASWNFLNEDIVSNGNDINNLPLGVIPETGYQQFGIKLWPGDILIMYTDAVLEARHANGQPLGTEGLLTMASSLQLEDNKELGEKIIQLLLEYYNIQDDLTVVALMHNGSDPASPSWKDKIQGFARMAGLS